MRGQSPEWQIYFNSIHFIIFWKVGGGRTPGFNPPRFGVNDSYIESDFKALDEETHTYTLNKKIIGEYFKQLFLDKEEIKPTSAII